MIRTILFFIPLILLAIFPTQGISQIQKTEAVFLGHIEEGYSFCSETLVGYDEILVFNEILSIILEKYPLHMDKHIGENFIISFTKDMIIEKEKSREVSTILRLQKLGSQKN